MPPDPESVSLPDPPPPRPAARDAAIEAAMRRFDAVEEPAVTAKPRPTPWARRPEFQLAMAASLALIIGVPAALIGTRGEDGVSSGEQAPTAPAARMAEPAQQPAAADMATNSAVEQDLQAPNEPAPQKEQVAPPSVAPIAGASVAPAVPAQREEYAAPAAPPPAPAPPPPALAQKSADTRTNDVVVTGSRIARPNLESASPVTVVGGQAAERDAIAKTNFAKKDRAYASFLDRLQTAVRDDDPAAVVKLISFPLRVNSGGQSQTYPDAKSVRRDFDRIFTAQVREAILEQRADRLFSRDLGVMVGNGEVWFDHVCLDESCSRLGPVRITAVNR